MAEADALNRRDRTLCPVSRAPCGRDVLGHHTINVMKLIHRFVVLQLTDIH